MSKWDYKGYHFSRPQWFEVQEGMPLRKMKMLDQLAHGKVTKASLNWICELIVFQNEHKRMRTARRR
jgi:hypothetical protein